MSRKLFKSTAIVSVMTLFSRILGFVRDMVFARLFGAGVGTDAFFIAFKIPNFLRRLFAEGAFSQAFVPVLGEYKTSHDEEDVRELVDRVAGTLAGILFLITLLGVLAAPVLIMIFAPGFIGDSDRYDLAVSMLRMTFPYLFFISLTAFAGSILNSYGKFAVPAFTPVFLNLSLIAAAIWLAPQMEQPVTALGIGVFVAGLVQLAFQLPFLKKLGLAPRLRWGMAHDGVRKILRLMLPAIFGSSVVQINLLFDTLIASFLVTGSVSWLYYSDRLVEFPLGIFGIALATVILPSLSQQHANKSPEHFSRTLDWALRWVLIVGVPATLGLFLLASPILITLFQYGEFSSHDVRMSSISLMAYSLGLLGFILVKILAPGFYARQDTRTPVKVGIIAMVSNMVLNILFVVPLVMGDYEAPHAGLALATSVSAFINAGLLFYILRRERVYRPEAGWLRLFLQLMPANILMVLFLWWGIDAPEKWLQAEAWSRIWHLAILVAGGGAVYLLGILATGLRPWQLARTK